MVDLNSLFEQGKISRIKELESERYISFLENSYKDNLAHSKKVIQDFPRWSIISGYYAMHDITKLLLAKRFKIKVDFNVHETTIILLRQLVKDEFVINLIEEGYKEFLSFASDLEEAKKERIKVQYYTGTAFLKKEYQKRAEEFNSKTVAIYIKKMGEII